MFNCLGFDKSMLSAERICRITLVFSLLLMLMAPFPFIIIKGFGTFAPFYPLLILPGFVALKATHTKHNIVFHILFPLLFYVLLRSKMYPEFIIILFFYIVYFQAEQRLYYLIKLQKEYEHIGDDIEDIKIFCKAYMLQLAKNAIIPTLIASTVGILSAQVAVFLDNVR